MKNDIHAWFEMVERLRSERAIWPEADLPVEIIQTHISVILLGKNLVLKLKKPVSFGFLDFTTLEKRRVICEREVELNSRLCPDIYLGTRAIVEDKDGFRYSDEGTVVEYGVLMKRLPEERMLDRMVVDGTVSNKILARIAAKLSAFHQTARRGSEFDKFGNLENIRFNWEENFEQTRPYIGRTVSAEDFELIRSWVDSWLEKNEKLLKQRVKLGKICDGHGDLRSESICVTNGICIFDCIEFNDRFRCSDVANEAAFLAMDLDAYGRPDLGYYFFERYGEVAGDERLFELYSFYRCYRAFVRGKVLSFQLDEPEVAEEERNSAKERADIYFKIAAGSARQLQTPTIIMVAGLSGTGKTTMARAIASELGVRVVSSDAVRRTLFAKSARSYDYGEGIYSDEYRHLTYRKMIEKGILIFQKYGNVILDATFQHADDRGLIRQTAESLKARCLLIECRLNPDVARQRLMRRAELEEGLSAATPQTYEQQRNDFEPIKMGEAHLVLDTEKNLSVNSRRAAEWLRTKSQIHSAA